VALDPFNPGLHVTYGLALMRLRRYEDAKQHFNLTFELDPKTPAVANNMLAIAELTDDPESVLQQVEKRVQSRGGDIYQIQMAGRLFARLGRAADAKHVITNLSNAKVPEPVGVSSIYAALGDKDHCFEWLEKFSRLPPSLRTSPFFDSVRSDPRFQALFERIYPPLP